MDHIFELDKKHLLNVYKRMNIEIIKAEGSFLVDKNNIKYLDMFSGIAVNNLGGGNPKIINAISDQIKKYLHLSNYFVSEPTVMLAKLLIENSQFSKVFFSNSGTEANEAALKLARKYGKTYNDDKIEILSSYNSFHGRTYGGLTLTGQEKYNQHFNPLIPGIAHFHFNDIHDLTKKVSNKTCAVFLELIQGEGGIREISQSFIDTLVSLSKQYNFLIIVDEIQTGLGRTGDLFAYQQYGFIPHVVTIAKSLGGGLPLGAMLVTKDIEDVLTYGEHGSTFGGNPIACQVGNVVVSEIANADFLNQVKLKSQYLLKQLKALQTEFSQIIREIRGRGLIIGIDVGHYAEEIKTKGLEKQLLLNITNQTVLRLLPPLTISISELDLFILRFKEILEALE